MKEEKIAWNDIEIQEKKYSLICPNCKCLIELVD